MRCASVRVRMRVLACTRACAHRACARRARTCERGGIEMARRARARVRVWGFENPSGVGGPISRADISRAGPIYFGPGRYIAGRADNSRTGPIIRGPGRYIAGRADNFGGRVKPRVRPSPGFLRAALAPLSGSQCSADRLQRAAARPMPRAGRYPVRPLFCGAKEGRGGCADSLFPMAESGFCGRCPMVPVAASRACGEERQERGGASLGATRAGFRDPYVPEPMVEYIDPDYSRRWTRLG